jgi:prepilin-type N-terminal cleavage/methylation domain-containing protein
MKRDGNDHRETICMMNDYPGSGGFTLLEVMMSLVVLSIGILGAVGMLQYAEARLQQTFRATRALAFAEARLESKQTAPWEQLLIDDLDENGLPEAAMGDSGLHGDLLAGDGIYTGTADRDSIHLMWTVDIGHAASLGAAGVAWIEVRALYETQAGQSAEIRLRSLRANPRYIGGY